MKPAVICEKVQGAAHKRRDMPCQDAYRWDSDGERTILAVADGHGSASCRYSGTGAELAAEVFCALMADLWRSGQGRWEELLAHLEREGGIPVAQRMEREWKRRVEEDYRQRQGDEEAPTAIHKLYGTTILGLMATDRFFFAFQLGDGDISYIDGDGCQEAVSGDKILGVETYSLSQADAWRQAVTAARRIETPGPFAFMLSTDGFSNSHLDHLEFQKSCTAYFDLLRDGGQELVSTHLGAWLDETSELGCGDDITLMIAYFDGGSGTGGQ